MTKTDRGWSPRATFAALIGTAALFAYYRNATFMGAVFSTAHAQSAIVGWAASPLMPLFALVISAVFLLHGGRGLPAAITGPHAPVIAGCLGSLGAAVGLLVRTGLLPQGCTVIAALLCAGSFVYATVLSGMLLCTMSTARMVGVVVTGYLLAFGLFVAIRQTPAIQACALGVPLASTLPWLVCVQPAPSAPWTRPQAGAALRSPLLWLLLILLAASSAVRSLLGENEPPSTLRTWTCAILSGSLVVAWAVGLAVGSRKPAGPDRTVLHALALCGALLGAVFLAAVFPYLAQEQRSSVYLAASARAALDALWLIAVCAWVVRQQLPVVPAFLMWGVGAWALQWLECYWALPHLLFGGTALQPQVVVAAAVVLLAFGLLALCGLLLAPTLREASATNAATSSEPAAPAPTAAQRLAARGLTPREAEVALLFAQGFSIGGVAERLGMEKSTAQSHSKAIYRKLGIHTKDELIALVANEQR